MIYRLAQSPADLQQVVNLELDVWGLNPIDAVPVNVLTLCVHNGGSVILAQQHDAIIGFAVSLPANRNGEWLLWSHITGVHPNYQGQGIGRTLKLKQCEWAAQQGYKGIGWTFDPLQTGNANFNLNTLGSQAVAYHENFYGEMNDAINAHPLPSDRLEVRWNTDPTENTFTAHQDVPVQFMLTHPRNSHPKIVASPTERNIGIYLPNDKKHDLSEWQIALRSCFQEAFALGYRAVALNHNEGGAYYLLSR